MQVRAAWGLILICRHSLQQDAGQMNAARLPSISRTGGAGQAGSVLKPFPAFHIP